MAMPTSTTTGADFNASCHATQAGRRADRPVTNMSHPDRWPTSPAPGAGPPATISACPATISACPATISACPAASQQLAFLLDEVHQHVVPQRLGRGEER